MTEAGVPQPLIEQALALGRGSRWVLPFRYVAAARACPSLEPAIDRALGNKVAAMPPLTGRTVILVDVSGSMDARLSAKSDMTRLDAAAALAALFPHRAEDRLRVFSFSDGLVECPPRTGMGGIDAIQKSQPHGCTYLGDAINTLHVELEKLAAKSGYPTPGYDRLIVITDEQVHTGKQATPMTLHSFLWTGRRFHGSSSIPDPLPGTRGYVINVASAKNGIGYGAWTHIDGWSEHIYDYIREHEAEGSGA
jgi:hypothetical protein